MNSPDAQGIRQRGSPESTRGEAPGPPTAEGTRALILRSRAIHESQARLAAAINKSAPHGTLQSQEDAFTPAPEAASVAPAERV